jgi:WD40 repeat protein
MLFSPRQLTDSAYGHILTNTAVWSPDGKWIVYDVRSDPAGANFDGTRIERVNIDSGRVEALYESQNGACCGVATYHPIRDEVVFIVGPENPTPDWQYSACHRQGVIVDTNNPGTARPLDARDLVSPFTPGALRGGTHVHVFSPNAKLVSFTYDDHLLTELGSNQRNVGVSVVGRPVEVPKTHPRNHDGSAYSVLFTKTVGNPQPGSDEISRAYEDAWIDNRRIAFLGDVVSESGERVTELFVVDLPDDLTKPGEGPLEGTATQRPAPPAGTIQRRITFTTDRKFPGIQGPRNWPRSSSDGRIAFLMRDASGIVQLWTVLPNGSDLQQITQNPFDIASAFNWHPDGVHVAAIVDDSVWIINTKSRESRRLTEPSSQSSSPRGEACVFSPDGSRIAYVQPVARSGAIFNQIFVVESGL